MFDLKEAARTIVNYCEEGDLMSGLSHFEGEVRPNIIGVETHEDQELLNLMKEALSAIDEEEWQRGLETVDKLSAYLNESR
jgi:2'-5' RNA ligase